MATRRGFLRALLGVAAVPVAAVKVLANPAFSARAAVMGVLPQINLKITSTTILARPRKLRVRWSRTPLADQKMATGLFDLT